MRKIMKSVIVTILLLTLSISTAFLIYLHFFAPGDRNLSGEWTAELDMTEQAAVTALIWLQDIEAVTISLEEMETYMQGLTVEVNMSLEQNSRSEGSFQCYILPESYDACEQAAYEAFAMAFQDLLALRLLMTNYEGGTDREDIEALVNETFGMSTVSYLKTYGPALLPSLEELQEGYDGSGTYQVTADTMSRQFDTEQADDIKMERYIRKGSELIVSGEADSDASGFYSSYYPLFYTLQESH